jgi:hypothetical protein
MAVPAVLLLAALTGCGDGDPEPEAAPSSDPTGFAVEEGITPEDLLTCLEDAGLPAVLDDATPMGVEVPVQGIEVEPLDTGRQGSPQGASLWVFADPAAAEENRPYITLSDEDTPPSTLAANVVVTYFYAPSDADVETLKIRECLPA